MKKLIKKILKKCGMVDKNEFHMLLNKLEKIEEDMKKIENKSYVIERDLFATYKSLEYKVWEFNSYTNKILYDFYIDNMKHRKNFNPLVSIIIPVYNGSNYLEQAIISALQQTYKNIEIIVVNDGSTDNGLSKNVANKFKNKIRYFEKKNGGVSSALNYGISKMKGEYFSWLSHDDLMEPNHIKNLLNFLYDLMEPNHIKNLINFVSVEGNNNAIPFSSFKIIDENGTLKVNETIIAQLHCFDYKTSVLKNEYTLLQGEINGGSVLIPKIAFDKYGLFSETQRITQERDMWARLIKEYKFINIPYDTAVIRSHSKQVTNTNSKIKVETDEKNLKIIKELSDDVIKRLEGNKSSFYSIMETFYKNNNNSYMQDQMRKLKSKYIKK